MKSERTKQILILLLCIIGACISLLLGMTLIFVMVGLVCIIGVMLELYIRLQHNIDTNHIMLFKNHERTYQLLTQVNQRAEVNTVGYETAVNRMMESIPSLTKEHIRNMHVYTDREAIIKTLPKGSVCAEVGVYKGDFAASILKICKPQRLYLFEIDQPRAKELAVRFRHEIEAGTVRLVIGDTKDTLKLLKDNELDWIFIDADHSYEAVKKDLDHARTKVKKTGLILAHDYILYDYYRNNVYGVVRAVNEFCHTHAYEIVMLSVEPHGFHTVALKKL